jgi:hypothetical protein
MARMCTRMKIRETIDHNEHEFHRIQIRDVSHQSFRGLPQTVVQVPQSSP